MDIKSLVRASYDPRRFSSAYHREKREIKNNLAQAVAAEGAPWGSLAAANDPTRWGSVARTKFPTLFTPQDQSQQNTPASPLARNKTAAAGAPTNTNFYGEPISSYEKMKNGVTTLSPGSIMEGFEMNAQLNPRGVGAGFNPNTIYGQKPQLRR